MSQYYTPIPRNPLFVACNILVAVHKNFGFWGVAIARALLMILSCTTYSDINSHRVFKLYVWKNYIPNLIVPLWRHQMETFSALLAICAGNSPVPGEFLAQRPVTRGFDVFFDLRPNKRLSKQSWGWWFETLSRSLWRQCNVIQAKTKYWSDHITKIWEWATLLSHTS